MRSIPVDGRDVADQLAPEATSCRLYPYAGGTLRGAPTEKLVRAAINRVSPYLPARRIAPSRVRSEPLTDA